MQSRLFVVAIACVVALQVSPGLRAGGSGDGNRSRTLTLAKECGTALLAQGELSYCTIKESNFRPLKGAKIRYFGPGFYTDDHPYLNSWIVIEGDGGTAFGHCLLRGIPEPLGACQITGGSGSLKGLKADVTVTTADGVIWYWKGAFAD
jgi:hypothetical protein